MHTLATALANGVLPSLVELRLDGNNIGDEGASMLAEALASSATLLPMLVHINLAYNAIGDAGISALAARLAAGALASVEGLDLSHNAVADDGIISLAAALVRGGLPRCRNLDLSHNYVGDRGLIELARILAQPHTAAAHLPHTSAATSAASAFISPQSASTATTSSSTPQAAATVAAAGRHGRAKSRTAFGTGRSQRTPVGSPLSSALAELRLGHNAYGDTGLMALAAVCAARHLEVGVLSLEEVSQARLVELCEGRPSGSSSRRTRTPTIRARSGATAADSWRKRRSPVVPV